MSLFRNRRANEVTRHLQSLAMNMNSSKRSFTTSALYATYMPLPHLHHNHCMLPWSCRLFSSISCVIVHCPTGFSLISYDYESPSRRGDTLELAYYLILDVIRASSPSPSASLSIITRLHTTALRVSIITHSRFAARFFTSRSSAIIFNSSFSFATPWEVCTSYP